MKCQEQRKKYFRNREFSQFYYNRKPEQSFVEFYVSLRCTFRTVNCSYLIFVTYFCHFAHADSPSEFIYFFLSVLQAMRVSEINGPFWFLFFIVFRVGILLKRNSQSYGAQYFREISKNIPTYLQFYLKSTLNICR